MRNWSKTRLVVVGQKNFGIAQKTTTNALIASFFFFLQNLGNSKIIAAICCELIPMLSGGICMGYVVFFLIYIIIYRIAENSLWTCNILFELGYHRVAFVKSMYRFYLDLLKKRLRNRKIAVTF